MKDIFRPCPLSSLLTGGSLILMVCSKDIRLLITERQMRKVLMSKSICDSQEKADRRKKWGNMGKGCYIELKASWPNGFHVTLNG